MADEYRRFTISSTRALERERLLALAFEAGAGGAEESEADDRFCARIYAPGSQIERLRSALTSLAAEGTEIGVAEALPDVDWREAWKDGLEALRISSRLVVRPPFVEVALEPGQSEVVIDPGQAFGTGAHASTRLCLEWIDLLYAERDAADRFDRVLDAGTGSGVLVFAALRLGARWGVGFDLDPIAIDAARAAAEQNGLADRTRFVAAPIDAVVDATSDYPLVVANLLKREVLPIARALAAGVARDGRLVLSGLLEEDVTEVLDRFAREGFVESHPRRSIEDGTGRWIGLCLARAGA